MSLTDKLFQLRFSMPQGYLYYVKKDIPDHQAI